MTDQDMHRTILDRTLAAAERDRQTTDAARDLVVPLPDGASFHDSVCLQDDRGSLTELYDPRWDWHDEPLVYCYMATIRPGISANRQSSSLESYIKIAHYTEMKPTLLQVLEKHREAIALPGEPLGVTHCPEHHIKLKQGSNPVYISAYKLPHNQR